MVESCAVETQQKSLGSEFSGWASFPVEWLQSSFDLVASLDLDGFESGFKVNITASAMVAMNIQKYISLSK